MNLFRRPIDEPGCPSQILCRSQSLWFVVPISIDRCSRPIAMLVQSILWVEIRRKFFLFFFFVILKGCVVVKSLS